MSTYQYKRGDWVWYDSGGDRKAGRIEHVGAVTECKGPAYYVDAGGLVAILAYKSDLEPQKHRPMMNTYLGSTDAFLSHLETEVDRHGAVAVEVELVHGTVGVGIAALLSRFSVTAHGSGGDAYYILRDRPETLKEIVTYSRSSELKTTDQ